MFHELPTNIRKRNYCDKKDQFPEDWIGLWQGELNIYKPNGDIQTIPMELEIAAMDSSNNFIWALIYGEDKIAGRRSYELETIDPLKGHYAIDEKNTIKLDCYLFQNKLFSRFQVMDNWLLATYEKEGENLIFEIISGNSQAVNITGNQKHNGEDIPEVKAFPIIVSQQAVLKRI